MPSDGALTIRCSPSKQTDDEHRPISISRSEPLASRRLAQRLLHQDRFNVCANECVLRDAFD